MPARFIAPRLPEAEACLVLDGDEAHHLSRVLRVRPGERVEGLDGRGGRWRSTVQEVDRRKVVLQGESVCHETPPLPRIGVALAPLKAAARDQLVPKMVELGVTDIWTVGAAHAVGEGNTGRLERLVDAALKQCGRAWRPVLHDPVAFSDWLATPPEGVLLLADLAEEARPLAEVLDAAKGDAVIWVGPEGDFSHEEVQQATEQGWQSVSLGPAVLRSDTAALYALSSMVYTLRRRTS